MMLLVCFWSQTVRSVLAVVFNSLLSIETFSGHKALSTNTSLPTVRIQLTGIYFVKIKLNCNRNLSKDSSLNY